MRKPTYLSQVALEEARRGWFAALGDPAPDGSPGILIAAETIPVSAAEGRVVARPVFARFSSPAYHACAMDGYAVLAKSTFGAGESSPVTLRVGEAAWHVDTGDALPPATDAVIMIEDVEPAALPEGPGIEIRAAAAPWQHVRPVGEDIAAGELLYPTGWRLCGSDLAALVSAGVGEVEVRRRPRVAVIPTGDEIVPLAAVGEAGPEPGQVIESNSLLVRSVAGEAGACVAVLPVVADDRAAIRAAVEQAILAADVVVVSAGSSAGSGDYVAEVLAGLGRVVAHGVATRPGKPVILAVCGGKPVLGMPGYPVSAWLSLDNFLRPLIERMLGSAPAAGEVVEARLGRRMPSPAGVREYLRVKLGQFGGECVAAPLARGAGVLTSLVRADAVVEVPPESEGLEAGARVRARLLRPWAEVAGGLVAIGSHDLSLDVLGDLLRRRHPGLSLGSVNAGSLAGLQALARGEAHLAGTHLLDERTGDYNASYVRDMMPGRRVALFCLVLRQQGLIVARGNPLGLEGVADLAAAGARFVNRQRGAGTRVLLDYLLRSVGVQGDAINGYRREVYTHLAVAAEVAGGGADAGMGIMAAARAAGLDFVPVAAERYELAIPGELWQEPRVQALLELAAGRGFREEVEALGGYSVAATGEVRWVEGAGS
jgi:putative molybdopterin biosynthesis protein